MTTNLKSELDCFFAEVDGITHKSSGKVMRKAQTLSSEGAPTLSWIRHLDPNTKLPFYHNKITKESTWEIPEEYQNHITKLEKKNQGVKKSLPNHIMPNVNSRKRRRIKRAWLQSAESNQQLDEQDAVPVEFLSEYIAYSDSDSEDSESDQESAISSKTQPSPQLIMNTSSPPITEFVGPLFPTHEPLEADFEIDQLTRAEVSTATENDVELIGPQLPPTLNVLQKVNEKQMPNLNETFALLMDKFAYLDPQADKLSPLQLMYIQLSTRFEDWSGGYLKPERFEEKLDEVKTFLDEHIAASIPEGWSFYWDRGNKRYVYTNEKTSVSQSYPPVFEGAQFPPLSAGANESVPVDIHEEAKFSETQPKTTTDEVPKLEANTNIVSLLPAYDSPPNGCDSALIPEETSAEKVVDTTEDALFPTHNSPSNASSPFISPGSASSDESNFDEDRETKSLPSSSPFNTDNKSGDEDTNSTNADEQAEEMESADNPYDDDTLQSVPEYHPIEPASPIKMEICTAETPDRPSDEPTAEIPNQQAADSCCEQGGHEENVDCKSPPEEMMVAEVLRLNRKKEKKVLSVQAASSNKGLSSIVKKWQEVQENL